MKLTKTEAKQVAEILNRRANDIATFESEVQRKSRDTLDGFPGSVELALTREIKRLRRLADKISPPEKEGDEE